MQRRFALARLCFALALVPACFSEAGPVEADDPDTGGTGADPKTGGSVGDGDVGGAPALSDFISPNRAWPHSSPPFRRPAQAEKKANNRRPLTSVGTLRLVPDESTRASPPRADRPDDAAPCVEVVEGLSLGKRIWLDERVTIVGRGEDAEAQLADDGLSRRHAKLSRNDDGLISVRDLDSKNGTLVNNVRTQASVLWEGDRIQLGPTLVLRFGYHVPPARTTGTSPSEDDRFSLTPRETEIASLVRNGLTNPQIGERLHISRHTVSAHLANIYARVDVANRSALAALVAAGRIHGLG